MERQMTAPAPPMAMTPRINARLLGQIGAAAGALALIVALGFAGTADRSGAEVLTSADQLRWQAVAASFDGASPVALAAETARWSAMASAHSSLSVEQAAAAARWTGLAEAESALTPAQAAYASRLRGAAASSSG